MKLSKKAQGIFDEISQEGKKLGDLRKIAKEIKRDHDLALELWSQETFMARQLAILLMDKKELSQEVIDDLCADIQNHELKERTHLIDWLMANQLSKDKKTVALMESWKQASSPLQRRLFWYYQARLRWTGKTDQTNTEDLLNGIEKGLMAEEPEVQWAMNFTAGQIGKWQAKYRKRCIDIGLNTGLYSEEVAPKNCTPNYLPKFIEIEVAKLARQKI